MKTIKQDWEEVSAAPFIEQLPDDQRERMKWAFYRGMGRLFKKINDMKGLSQEEHVQLFQELKDELLQFFKDAASPKIH